MITNCMYGNPNTTAGGKALPFYASIRIEVKKGENIFNPNNKDEQIGQIVNCRMVKNKTAQPFKNASFPLIYGIGVDKRSEILDIAILTNIINKGGAWLSIKDEDGKPITRNNGENEVIMNFQGKEKFLEYLRTDDSLYDLLTKAVFGEIITLEQFKGVS